MAASHFSRGICLMMNAATNGGMGATGAGRSGCA
jgi:hypothetical protein